MGDVTNLNRFRKDKARAGKRAKADENAVKHGRTRAQKEAERARAEKAARALEAHRKAPDT
ncbi:DUF4169 family protein [Sinisalibacter lacisalsi]|uniref:DUF4169 domain-containing protein n=1 Tax=Sinisalibacter lacisalsi TaxID=1526570 RepID=A0ABQ1QM61_9RHOB|nr:DUF4169 family protein [Sinisalibacter lacisalsi]GGD30760.1 hypothetical protein GCM10011358_13500 [Sinisalibacter lacisalsi]